MNEEKQAGQLYLDDYKNALQGEICGLIGHNPDDDEFEQMSIYAADYVADCVNEGKLPNLTGLGYSLLVCKKEQFIQCNECGDYFLPREINSCGGCYCLGCKPNYDPDGMPGGWDDLKTERGEM